LKGKVNNLKGIEHAGFGQGSFFLPYFFLDEKVTKNQALYFLFKAARASQKPKLHKSAQLLWSILRKYALAPCAELIRFLTHPASQENKAQGSI
jgi:hypothetical protein